VKHDLPFPDLICISFVHFLWQMSRALHLKSTQAENNMDVDAADVEHISSPIAYHADLMDSAYKPEATLVYDITEEDATEVGAVVKSTRARSGGRIQVSSPFYFAVNYKCYVNNEGLEIDCQFFGFIDDTGKCNRKCLGSYHRNYVRCGDCPTTVCKP
jgi:hypothetical protein